MKALNGYSTNPNPFDAGYEAAKMLKEKGITIEDVNAEIAYRKETNAFSNQPQNEAFMNMTLNEVMRVKEMWYID